MLSLAILSGGSGGEAKLRKDTRNGRAMVQRDEPEPLVPPPGAAAAAPGVGVDLVAVPAAEEDRLCVRPQGVRRGGGWPAAEAALPEVEADMEVSISLTPWTICRAQAIHLIVPCDIVPRKQVK